MQFTRSHSAIVLALALSTHQSVTAQKPAAHSYEDFAKINVYQTAGLRAQKASEDKQLMEAIIRHVNVNSRLSKMSVAQRDDMFKAILRNVSARKQSNSSAPTRSKPVRSDSPSVTPTSARRLTDAQVSQVVTAMIEKGQIPLASQTPTSTPTSTSAPTPRLSDNQVAAIMESMFGTPTTTSAPTPAATPTPATPTPTAAPKPTQNLSDSQIAAIVSSLFAKPTASAPTPVATSSPAPTAIAAPSPAPAPAPVATASPEPTPAPSTPVVGNALVSWSVPNLREDGSSLTAADIQGYEIYYTSENSGASEVIRIDNANQTQFTVNNLPVDSYHFSMVAIDANGTYSDLSAVVSKTVN